MATVEANLRTLLLTFSGVTTLVGTGDAARIRPDRLHQDADKIPVGKGGVIIEVDNEAPLNDLSGVGGRVYADVNLKCRAASKAVARALAESIRSNDTDPGTGLAGYNGTPDADEIDAVLEDMTTSFTPAGDGSDQGYYDVDCSYSVTYAEVK
jgi:hypothetical protein